jgi:putative SOS response-associated peptidase YedK
MCGRVRLSRRKQPVEEYFASVVSGEDDQSPRFNIAPTQSVSVIRQNPKYSLFAKVNYCLTDNYLRGTPDPQIMSRNGL